MEKTDQLLMQDEITPRETVPTGASRGTRQARLGEELPIFCEQCGYALHGLPVMRCDQCQILHFRCPECGHTQPINTLRPAVQRVLGTLRAWTLGLWVFVKINFFFWMLFGWLAMGHEWSYTSQVTTSRPPAMLGVTMVQPIGPRTGTGSQAMRYWVLLPREIDIESVVAFGLFGLSFGMVARMLLLRWRRSYIVGGILAGLVIGSVICGALFRQYEREAGISPLSPGFWTLLGLAGSCLMLGAVVVFPVWAGLVRLLLPSRMAKALLDWQMGKPEDMYAADTPKPAPA